MSLISLFHRSSLLPPISSPLSPISSFLFPFSLLLLTLIACEDAPPVPEAAPAVDRMARSFLGMIARGDIDSIRAPLSAAGKEQVTSLSLARTLAFFQAGPPSEVALIDAEVADSHAPTVAERHRLTYRLGFPDDRIYYYFFELIIESGDSTITGFRIEPREETEPKPLAR